MHRVAPAWSAYRSRRPTHRPRRPSDTPLKRFGSPDEVAAIVAMLASDEAGYVTGAEINIDGGLLAGSGAVPGVESNS